MSAGRAIALWFALLSLVPAYGTGDPAGWVPARWDGGPLEAARRTRDKTLPADASARQAIEQWYDPATLDLIEGTPINCLLLTFRAEAAPEVQAEQQKLVAEYARRARERGIAVLGIVYAGPDPADVAAAAVEARLDGLVLDSGFPAPAAYIAALEAALRSKNAGVPVIAIAKEAAALRTAKVPVAAVEGVRPSARDLADMGIRAGASAEPWIESNIWLVRSFRLDAAWRPVWVSQQPNPSSVGDYVRCVADAAVGGGRWVVALDDDFRAGLRRKDPQSLAAWSGIARYLKFAEEHAGWRAFAPYGNLGIILDTAGDSPEVSNEYLNLVARRQIPYRVIPRSRLTADALASFRAVLAADLAPPTDAERALLRGFAAKGGVIVTGASWGDAPKEQPFAEAGLGQGRVVVYKDDPPDPEAVARDLSELLDPELIGLTAFNVPSVLTYASMDEAGKRVLVQLLNYAGSPFDRRITIRVNGSYKTARLYTPEAAPLELTARPAAGGRRTEVTVPRLAVWGALLLE